MADTKNGGTVMDRLKHKVDEEEIARNLENCPIKNEFVRKYLVVIPAVLSLAGLFLPFMEMTMPFQTQTGSVFEVYGGDYGSDFTWLLLLFPALVIVANFLKALKPYRRIISIGAPVLSVIALFLTFSSTESNLTEAMNQGISVSVSCVQKSGFYVLLLSYALTALAGLVAYFGVSLKKNK